MSTQKFSKFLIMTLAMGMSSHNIFAAQANNQCLQMKEALQSLAKKQESLPINFTDSQGNKFNSFGDLQAHYDELSARYVILKGMTDLKFKFDMFKQKALDKDFGNVDSQLLLDIKNVAIAKDTAKRLAILHKELQDNFSYQTLIGNDDLKVLGTQISPVAGHYESCLQSNSLQSQAPSVCDAATTNENRGIASSINQMFRGGGYSEMINGFNQAQQVLINNQSSPKDNEIRDNIIESYRNISGDLNNSQYYQQMSDVMSDTEKSMLKNIYELMEQRVVNDNDTGFQNFRNEFANNDLEKFQEEYSQCFANSMFSRTGSPLSDCENKKQAINNSAKNTLQQFQNFLLAKDTVANSNPAEMSKKELNLLNEKQNIMAKVKSLEDFAKVVDANNSVYNFSAKDLIAQHCSNPSDIKSCMQEINAQDLKAQTEKAAQAFTEIQKARANIIKLFDNPEYLNLETMKQYMIADIRNGRCDENPQSQLRLIDTSDCARNLDSSRELTSFVKIGESVIRAIDNRFPSVYEEERQSLAALSTISDYCKKEYNLSSNEDNEEEEEDQSSTTTSTDQTPEDIIIGRHCDNYMRRYTTVKRERSERAELQKKQEDLKNNHYVYNEAANVMEVAPKRSTSTMLFVSGMKSSLQLLPVYFQGQTNKTILSMQTDALIARKQYIHSMQGAYQWYGYGVSSYGLNYPVNSNFYYNNPIYFQSQNNLLQSVSSSSSTATPNSFSW